MRAPHGPMIRAGEFERLVVGVRECRRSGPRQVAANRDRHAPQSKETAELLDKASVRRSRGMPIPIGSN